MRRSYVGTYCMTPKVKRSPSREAVDDFANRTESYDDPGCNLVNEADLARSESVGRTCRTY